MNKKGCAAIGFIFITVLASPFLALGYIRLDAANQTYSNIEEIPEKETAVVLGAAAYPSRLSTMLEDRVKTAIELYEAGKVKKIIMTGGDNEAPAMKEYAIEKGVPEKDIQEDPKGINTLTSLRNLVGKETSITIVTQAYHLPRSIFIAESHGLDVVGMAADQQAYGNMEDYKKRELLATVKAVLDVFFGK